MSSCRWALARAAVQQYLVDSVSECTFFLGMAVILSLRSQVAAFALFFMPNFEDRSRAQRSCHSFFLTPQVIVLFFFTPHVMVLFFLLLSAVGFADSAPVA